MKKVVKVVKVKKLGISKNKKASKKTIVTRIKNTATTKGLESFQILIENLPVGVLKQGPKAEIIISNKSALKLLGLTESQLLGKTSFDPDWSVIHEDGSPFPGPTHPVPVAIATKKVVREVVMGVFRPRTKDRVWLLVDAIPQFDSKKKLDHVICTFTDITEKKRLLAENEMILRKQNEKSLLLKEEQLRTIIQTSLSGFLLSDMQGKLLDVNDAYCKMSGYSKEELLRMKISDLESVELLSEVKSHVKKIIEVGADRFESKHRKKDDSEFDVRISVQFNSIIGQNLVTFVDDISESKKAEKKLIEYNEILLTLNKDMENFGYVAVHDFKSPINNLQALVALIEEKKGVKPEMEPLFEKIKFSLDKLQAKVLLLNEAISSRRVDGQQNEYLSFEKTFAEIRTDMEEQIKETGATIVADFSKCTHIHYPAIHLQSLMQNLLSNAIKYRQDDIVPIVKITTFLEEGKPCMTVEDNGLGIDLELQKEKMFGLFNRFHTHIEGKGIGLYLVNSIISSHRGKIEVTSEVNRGTTFKLYLSNEEN